jgi:membrane protease YdiL (CAAX protease family)
MQAQGVVQYLADSPSGPELWFVVVGAVVAAPIAEEIFFRGYLYRLLETIAGGWFAVIGSAILFGLLHEPSVRIPVGVLGLLFGYLRMRTGGIGSSILVHALHNGWTVAIFLAWPEALDLLYDR